jgi:hypothetical protein
METSLPEGDAATLAITMQAPRVLTLALRRPSWAGDGFAIRLNGRLVPVTGGPGSYVEIAREWRTGDTLALVLPKVLRIERLRDDARRAAVMWGPLVLAGDLGPQPHRSEDGDGDGPTEGSTASPVLVTERPVTEWLKPVAGRPGSFRTSGMGVDVVLSPFYQLHRRVYTAYWDLLTPAENTARLKAIEAERARVRRLEAATIAFLAPGDDANDRAHNQQGESTSIVRTDGRPGRRAAKWFAYDLPLAGGTAAALVVTYNRDNRRARSFEIVVDGERIAQERIPFDSDSRFYDRAYALPPALVQGKTQLTIRFQALEGNEVAPVYGLRLIRAGGEPDPAR